MTQYEIIIQASTESEKVYAEVLERNDVAPYLKGAYSMGAKLISITDVVE